MKPFVFILLLFCRVLVCAQSPQKYTKDGFALQAGIGSGYGGNGLMGEYQFIIPGLKFPTRITPVAGVGFSAGGPDSGTSVNYWLNASIGCHMEWGQKHRLFAGPHVHGNFNAGNKPSGAGPYKKFLYSPSFIIGYKGTAAFGLIWQVYTGLAYMQNPLIRASTYFLQPDFGVGIGYKF